MPEELPAEDERAAPQVEPPGPPIAPQAAPRLVERFMAEFRGGFASGSILDKLSSAQINKLLDQTSEEARRQHELDVQQGRLTFALLLSIPVFILALCFLFLHYEKGDLLR